MLSLRWLIGWLEMWNVGLQMATEGTNKKTMGILFWESKPITAKVWVDRMGYVPGEKIFFNARVDNPTNKKMRGSKVQLVEVTGIAWNIHCDIKLIFVVVVCYMLCQRGIKNRNEDYQRNATRKLRKMWWMGSYCHYCASGGSIWFTSLQHNRHILSNSGKLRCNVSRSWASSIGWTLLFE